MKISNGTDWFSYMYKVQNSNWFIKQIIESILI